LAETVNQNTEAMSDPVCVAKDGRDARQERKSMATGSMRGRRRSGRDSTSRALGRPTVGEADALVRGLKLGSLVERARIASDRLW
jgi:hypothetical protein